MEAAPFRLNEAAISSVEWSLPNNVHGVKIRCRTSPPQLNFFANAQQHKSPTLKNPSINYTTKKSPGLKREAKEVMYRKPTMEPIRGTPQAVEDQVSSTEGLGPESVNREWTDYSLQGIGRSSWLTINGARRPLSKEEEQSLFQDIQDLLYLEKKKEELTQSLKRTPSDQEWADFVKCSVFRVYARLGKGRAARRKIIAANLPLVESMAKQFDGQGLSHQELCQEGALGLLKSTEKFNTSYKSKFSTYAFYWIYEKMSKSLKKSKQLMKIGRPIYETASWVLRCKDEFHRLHGRYPTLDELSQASKVTKDRIPIVLNTLKPAKYLDAMFDGKGGDPSDVFHVKQEYIPWETMINNELKDELTKALELLAPRERQVVRLRYGFDDGVPYTRSEVASSLGLHYQSVMVTEKNALKKLQKLAERQGLRQYLSEGL